ncbi:uncharacterized protein E0L32_011477 [Thyridium curvatum]|uniref:DNA replication ATP-dependent helicase/nuclease n=1 Tax=Thyridium curvatum TaxID=1093900 RepID=A0A507B961_9PEZI|nr:uncharacterized protein E0L32_011477 [Thyridium curvatum]TPX18862.1 hypothetical protein E0L32_011477 [Thyridium curvatum]
MTLQKSFSEQNRFSRRPQWNRSKSGSAVGGPRTSRPPRPPVPISEVTKNKLHQFEFQPAVEETSTTDATKGESDKENHGSLSKHNVSPPAMPKPLDAMTPIARLAWQDLMGATDNANEEEDTSPTERILWHNERDKLSAVISPMLHRTGKKRARSSSPTSSPSTSKPTTPAVNMRRLKEALKSPQADPAVELWDRFSLSGTSNTPLGRANPMLANLMVSSSPRPAHAGANGPDEKGFRRAASCGTSWAKRRRVEKGNGRSPSMLRQEASDSKSSMVSALLKSVTGELDNSEVARHTLLQRSPSPQKRSTPEALSPSKAPKCVAAGTHKADTFEEDFGDDDFDDDTLMELDASLIPQEGGCSFSDAAVVPSGDSKAASPLPVAAEDEEDEFGDLDDDVFAAAEDIIADIDQAASQMHEPKISAPAASGQSPTDIGDSGGGATEADDAYSDDFGDFDFDAAELAATQSMKPPTSSTYLTNSSQKSRIIQRYLVTNVLDSSYENDAGREFPEKVLVIQAERTSSIMTVHLRGDWVDTPVSTKSYVHIIGKFESTGMCIIDNTQNMLILHPDQLISSTVIADSFSCMRRAVLQDRVKATSEASPALVYGTLLHEIFQEALMANSWDAEFLASKVDRAIQKHVEELYTIKVSVTDAREHLLTKMKEARYWAEAFVSGHPRSDALVEDRNGQKINMCVSKLLDVEEHVWSPMYGLKGNIDATVQVTMREGPNRRTLTVPFELKTGRNVSSNHQVQTMLYNLLLSDRYDIEIVYGILYYMETSQTFRIPAIRHELRQMIQQRNQLACYIRERNVQLPPMKKAKHACSKCYAQTSCFIYHKLADEGDGETSGMGDKFDEVVKHLTPPHREFFLKWENLLTKEEKESQKLRRELWTMISSEREKLGRCFGDVIIEEGSALEDKSSPKINRFQYTFIKAKPAPGFSFLDSQLAVGEPIVVSDEQGHFALALGYVTTVRKQRISVAVDRRLHNARIRQRGFDENDNQVFASIMEVVPEGVPTQASDGRIKEPPVRYRLDKDEFSNGMAIVRNNLVQVMADGPFGSREIRRLVVDLVPPTFKAVPTQYTITDDSSLNVDQKKAIQKVMSARDYALVLGMPGTGKTTTIAHIIRALISQGKSVLLTSYTHTAVDNILLKLKTDNIPILRLGAPAKVHPEVQEFAVLAGQPMSTFEEIHSAWHDTPVVATTCLGISHPVFGERTFDYCIVDEASQITLPICLGPIRMARTFVLVGDHNQLPPLVQNEEARLGGLDISLFKLLSDAHPDSVVNLEHQYRMNEDIMALSNTLIYQGRLKCGTESVRSRTLDVPDMDALRRFHYTDAATFMRFSSSSSAAAAGAQTGPANSFCPGARRGTCWLRDLLDPQTRCAFVNTDAIAGAREEAKGNRIVNPTEARIVSQLVEALLAAGVPASEVGVMTHYRSQLSLLKHCMSRGAGAGGGDAAARVEMHTADRFQGRDKEVVVLSLVRSNEARSIGELLKDWRRINVAFTRAKTKLLVVGSRETLRGCGPGGPGADGVDDGEVEPEEGGGGEMLARFVALMEQRAWVYDLPADALGHHAFEDGVAGTAASAALGTQQRTTSPRKTPKKKVVRGCGGGGGRGGLPDGKENYGAEDEGGIGIGGGGPKRARIGERALLRGKPILRDILNDMVGGGNTY